MSNFFLDRRPNMLNRFLTRSNSVPNRFIRRHLVALVLSQHFRLLNLHRHLVNLFSLTFTNTIIVTLTTLI